MRPHLTSHLPAHDFAITTPFCREPVDVDDTVPGFWREPVDVDETVPVELYSRPYERLDIQVESRPYELIEIELEIDIEDEDDAPRTSFPLVLTISMLCGALGLGVGLAFLVLR